MKKETFTKYFNKTELKKYINYTFFNSNFSNQTKVKRINVLSSTSLIFTVTVPGGNILFSPSEHTFKMQSCNINKKGLIQAVFTCSVIYKDAPLKNILRTIDFFSRFPKDAKKMQFPDINLKHEINI